MSEEHTVQDKVGASTTDNSTEGSSPPARASSIRDPASKKLATSNSCESTCLEPSRKASPLAWLRLLQVYQVYKFLEYRMAYNYHSSLNSINQINNYHSWRQGLFLDTTLVYWSRGWSVRPGGELSNAPLEWNYTMKGTENDDVYRENIEKILLNDIEGVSVQEAVKNAWKFTMAWENKHPRDEYFYKYGLQIWDTPPVEKQNTFLRTFNCDLYAKDEWRKDTEHRRPKVPRTHATPSPVRRRWLRRPITEPHLYGRSVSVEKSVDGTHREIFLVNRCMSTVFPGADDLYEKENGGPVFQQPTTSAHQLLQRLDPFLPSIPGDRPKVEVTDEDIDKFFIVFGPTKDLLEYVLNNRPSEKDRKELEDLCKET